MFGLPGKASDVAFAPEVQTDVTTGPDQLQQIFDVLIKRQSGSIEGSAGARGRPI